jgi:APA family basic amino acid/polyamine antiporter
MRFTHKEVPRGFRVPFGPWVIPPIGAMLCLLLMITSSKETGIRLAVWMAVGQVIYFSYGFWHSKLRTLKPMDPDIAMDNFDTQVDNQPTTNEYISDLVIIKDEKLVT